MRLAAVLALALLTTVARAQDAPPPAMASEVDFRKVVREAKARVFPAVVYIKCVREGHETGRLVSQEVTGSGAIISPDGEVVTNWHVVDRARSVRCQLADGRGLDARVVGSDKPTDLALLKLELPEGAAPLPYARFGDSTALEEGDFVMAMGAPWGLNRSVSIGIISCTTRFLPEASEYSLWLQTDAAISPGNSGGPLVDTEGRIIGINARGVNQGGDMGFAIPARTALVVTAELRAHGRVGWSWTGLQLQPLRDFNRNVVFEGDRGVIVADTDPASPAREAGLLPRDRIVSIGGRPCTAMTEEDLPAVRMTFGLLEKGAPVALEVVRGDATRTVSLTPREQGRLEGEELDCPRWDLTVKAINQFERADLHFYRAEGVFVLGLKQPGNAAGSGLRPGDILLDVDGQEVKTLDDVRRLHQAALEKVASKHRAVFTVIRGGQRRVLVLDFARDFSKE